MCAVLTIGLMTARRGSADAPARVRAARRVRMPGPVLTYADVRAVLARLQRQRGARGPVELDFSRVREIAPPWTPVFGLLTWFAAHGDLRLVLTGMQARIAAMAALTLEQVQTDAVDIATETRDAGRDAQEREERTR
jgi:hypothetical protein